MGNVTIENVPPENWEVYKSLRLEMLKEVPQAYGQAYEDVVKWSDEQWKETLSASSIVVVRAENSLIGTVGISFQKGLHISHIAHIWGVYVKKEFRGKGFGKLLLEEAEREIRRRPEIVKIKLEASTSQEAAKALYKKMGYEAIGFARKEIKVGDTYYDEYLLEKLL